MKELLSYNRSVMLGLEEGQFQLALNKYLAYVGKVDLSLWCKATSTLRKTGRFQTLLSLVELAEKFKSKYNRFLRLTKIRELNY